MLYFTNIIFETLDSEPKPLCWSFVILNGYMHSEVHSSKYFKHLTSQEEPTPSSQILQTLIYPSHCITTSPTVNLIEGKKKRERHTHSHRAPPRWVRTSIIAPYLLDGSTTAKLQLPPITGRYGIQRYQFQFNKFACISL